MRRRARNTPVAEAAEEGEQSYLGEVVSFDYNIRLVHVVKLAMWLLRHGWSLKSDF